MQDLHCYNLHLNKFFFYWWTPCSKSSDMTNIIFFSQPYGNPVGIIVPTAIFGGNN